MDFRARTFDRLSVQGPTAWLTGKGTVNGRAGSFWIVATDEQADGGGGVDRVRIWIWDQAASRLVFDNEPGRLLLDPPATPLGGGTIQIRRKDK